MMRSGVAGAALAGVFLASSVNWHAQADTPETAKWRKITQSGQRFAIFINEPGAARDGEKVTLRMVYVYMPGEVKFEDKPLGWQEFPAMTINCSTNEVRNGALIRFAPDGAQVSRTEDQTFREIMPGVVTDDAARAKCRKDYRIGDITIPNGPEWMEAARKAIAKTSGR